MPRLFLVLLTALALAAPAHAAVRPGWAPTGSMAVGHAWAEAVLLDTGQVLIAGGDAANERTRVAELYDPATGAWSPAGSMVVARTSFAMTKLANGKVLAAGGYNPTLGMLNTAEIYDPATNAWMLTGPMSTARNRATLTALPDGRALVAGGEGPLGFSATADVYEPSSNAWVGGGAFGDPRIDHSATRLADGRVLIAGGFSGNSIYQTAWVYAPASNAWAPAASLSVPRSLFGLSLLPNGRVLATGGDNSSGRLNSAELFSPGGGPWTAAATMGGIHYQHTATGLANGKVLVVAGLDGPNIGAAAELYDPNANQWAGAGTLATPRYQHTATLLGDGRVLVAGGYENAGSSRSAEIWTPTTSLAAEPAVGFGDQVTTATTPGAVQITNTGDSPLLLDGFALGGAQPSEFAVTPGCRTVAVGATCVLGVGFTPAAAGPRSATLTFSANTATGTHAVTLSGRGVAPAGQPTPPPVQLRRVTALLDYKFSRYSRRNTRFTRLVIKVNPGTTVTATCTRGCASKRVLKRNAKGTVSLKALIRKPVKAGSSIRVTVTQTGRVGAVLTLAVRKGKQPKLSTRCLPPGAKKTVACS